MAGSKKKAAGAPGSGGGGATVEPLLKFGVTSEQLVELMSLRTKEERSQALAEYEGVEGLMGHLEVNRKTGLPADSHELARRRAAFGTNVIPSTPPKAFIALCIDAIQVMFHLLSLPVIVYAVDTCYVFHIIPLFPVPIYII